MMRRFSTIAADAVPKPSWKVIPDRVKVNVKVGPVNGRLRRSVAGEKVIHASQRPAETANIDFDSIGLTYKLTHPTDFVVQRHAWAPKPEVAPDLPFAFERSLIGNALPVYTNFTGGRTKVTTQLRKCRGDIQILKAEVEKVVGKPVQVRPGKLVIDGNFDRRLKTWLTGLGF